MPVYFFHLETQAGLIHDEKGEEFGLLQEAKGAALVIASELARNQERIPEQHKRLKGAEVELWLPDPWLSGSGAELGRGNRAAECRGMGVSPKPSLTLRSLRF